MNNFFKLNWKRIIIVVVCLISISIVYSFEENNYDRATKSLVLGSNDNKLEVVVMDVGQGDSILIRTPEGGDVLIDSGPDASADKKLGKFLPYGDRDIELALLTHPHSDHVAGFNEIMKNYNIKKIMMTGVLQTTSDYLNFLNTVKDQKIPVDFVTSTETVYLPGKDANSTSSAYLEIMTPESSLIGQRIENLNNSSIVAKLIYGSTTMMLTGDMEQEEKLVERGLDLKSDVLKVGHHGSVNANDIKFLTAVNPKYAAISVGKNNSFGHPHFRTIHDLDKLGAQILRTDLDGDIVFVSDGKSFDLVK